MSKQKRYIHPNEYSSIRNAIAAAEEWTEAWDGEGGIRITLEDDGAFALAGHGTPVWSNLSKSADLEGKICALIHTSVCLSKIS